MNGIYIHIPFCRQACRYCDFYFTVSQKHREDFLRALIDEIGSGRMFPDDGEVSSIYFGGGTPSLFSTRELEGILNEIYRQYRIDKNPEITLEANPDDLTKSYLKALRNLPVNRLSIGVQSFDNALLDLMRRAHDTTRATDCLEDAFAAGFEQINADLIYGIPGLSAENWEKDLLRLFAFPVNHLSAYHLTFEPGTVFDHWRKKGRLSVTPEEESIEQYRILREQAEAAGFEHYEISNFARNGFYSRHNSLYWNGGHYLGFGPSAHSYDGKTRSWNVSNVSTYCESLAAGRSFSEQEVLSAKDRYHDYLLTSLRTSRGADPEWIRKELGPDTAAWFEKQTEPFISSGELFRQGGKIKMTGNSWFVADHILRELFLP